MCKILYIFNGSRAHKILPLLEDANVGIVRGFFDVVKLLFDKTDYRIVLIDGFGRYGIKGYLSSLITNTPLAVRIRGSIFKEQYEMNFTRKWTGSYVRYMVNHVLSIICLTRAKYVICNSESVKQDLRPYLYGKEVYVVHNPYSVPVSVDKEDANTPGLPDAAFKLLSITNFNLVSKTQPFIDILKLESTINVLKEYNISWVICGRGVFRGELVDAIRALNMQKHVEVIDHVQDVSWLYNWTDIFIHLTYLEAFPNVVMEAMHYKKPVITNHDSGGTMEIVTRDNGIILMDHNEFSGALQQYIEDRELIDQHGNSGRSLVRSRYTEAAIRASMNNVLHAIC